MGFCFGGLCALGLARTGVDVRGVASFHGLLGAPGNREGTSIKSRVIAFHGWDDPMAPPDHVTALGEELTRAGADRSEEHTSEPQSLMRISYAVFCLKKKKAH